jgi:hypothetical protein
MKITHHLKHTLVPHRHNHHRPHLIRPLGLAIVAALIVLQQVHLDTQLRHSHGSVLAYASDITPIELLHDTNLERTKVGLAPLRLDAKLNSSAAAKASDMFAYNYWSHVSPSGVQPWHWFEQAGYKYAYAGENLAKDFDTTAGVTQGWMNSPTHRDNLLNSHYVDVGYAVVNGSLMGTETTLVVAHYGTAVPTTVIAQSAPPPAAAKVVPKAKVVATPTPVATPAPSAAPQLAAAQTPTNYSVTKPLPVSSTLATTSKVSLALILLVLTIMLWSHTTVWRRRIIHGYTHTYKLRVAFELAVVGTGAILVIAQSFGSVS